MLSGIGYVLSCPEIILFLKLLTSFERFTLVMRFYQVKALVTVFGNNIRQNSHILGTSKGFIKPLIALIKSFRIPS